MISIDPKDRTERENYKLLIGSVTPRPIAFVTTENRYTNEVNGAPFSFFNIVSSAPPMISVAVQRKNGEMKDTAYHIQAEKEFVVHVVDEDNVEKVNKTAANLPRQESEITHAGFQLINSDLIQTRGIKEAKIRFECKLFDLLTFENEGKPSTDFIIGEVVRFHIDESIYNDGKIMYEPLRAVSRLAGNDYATIGDIMTIERPD